VSRETAAWAEVLLDLPARGTERQLTYRVPDSLRGSVRIGSRIVIPLGKRIVRGCVTALLSSDPPPGLAIRDILEVVGALPLFSPRMLDLARWIAEQTVSTLLEAVHCLAPPELFRRRAFPAPRPAVAALEGEGGGLRGAGSRQARILSTLRLRGEVPVGELVREGDRPAFRRLVARGAVRISEPPLPRVLGEIAPPRPEAQSGSEAPTLIWGDADARRGWIVQEARATVERGGRVLVIVPEIALVPLFVRSLEPIFSDAVVAFHSGLGARERQAAWRRCLAEEVRVVVGTRSALFAPLDNVRLIIVDDEHDPAHQADAAPRYHARDVAVRRGALDGARVVLGSLTPSVETYAQVASGRLRCVRLAPAAPRVAVTLIDMRVERAQGRRGLLTPVLIAAIRRHLRAGGRVALFVNRTGYARVLLCDECGAAVRCPRCEVTVPFDRERRTVSCRICGATSPAPATCPRCGGVGLRGIGPGTERVEEVIRRLFPALRIARVERETAPQFDRIANEFASGRLRLVIGTQLLLRARQIRPTLVGVCDADLPLHLPDFRGTERTLQQLRGVISIAAGRPGPDAVVQTRVPDHPAVRALASGDDEAVYRGELEMRRELGYPPYATLARMVASHASREGALRLAAQIAEAARAWGVEVLGPAPSRDPWGARGVRYQCLLRAADPEMVRAAARAALGSAPARQGGRITVEMNPQEFH
jgi:primosomal protein N' (replication factor Y) (superfamily II helicase)